MPKNALANFVTAVISGVITLLLMFMFSSLHPASMDARLEVCNEFINVNACQCWVNGSCGTDWGRSAARIPKEEGK